MIYKIKQKMFSFKDEFSIKNQYDEDVYFVEGKFFTMGHKLKIKDTSYNDLLYIEQKIFKFLPEYHIYDSSNVEAAIIKKKFTFFKPQFVIESKYGNYEINGQVLQHDFIISKNGIQCAEISKQWFSLSDTYGVEVSDEEKPEFILALVIILDMVIDDERRN